MDNRSGQNNYFLNVKPTVPKLRVSKLLSYFLDSVNIAAVAAMLSVFEMGYETLTEWQAIVIAVLSFLITFITKKVRV